MRLIRRFVDLGIGPETPVTAQKHVRVTNVATLAVLVVLLAWLPVGFARGLAGQMTPNLVGALVLLGVPWLNTRGRHYEATVLMLCCSFVAVGLLLRAWGLVAGGEVHLVALAVLPYLALPSHRRRTQVVLGLVPLSLLAMARVRPDLFAGTLPAARFSPLANAVLASAMVTAAGLFFARALSDTEDALEQERQRSESLLLNVLPSSVADRLKQGAATVADSHQDVSVLFADVVGFTPLSARISAEHSVALLNEIHSRFDAICDAHGVEKIRTIGDGYMAVAGAPNPDSDHAASLAAAALEIRAYMATHPELDIRIGMNSGKVVAGIVGATRFHYDVWGDAVNVAARMESLGEPGRIHLAPAIAARLRDRFHCVPRGTVEVKGKGPMQTWFLEGALRDELG